MTGFIPKEKLTAYQRWELAAFDEAEREAAQSRPPEAEAGARQAPEIPETPEAEAEAPPPPVDLPTAEDIEKMYADAHESGYAGGYEEGIARGRADAAQIGALLGNLQRALQEIDQRVADQLLELALEIAGQVLRQSLRVNPELLLPAVREAVAALAPHHGHPVLFVHPDDAALVRTHLGDQLANAGWRIFDDAAIEAGGCRVELGASEVDATLETRWRRVVESIGASRDWPDSGTKPPAP